MDSVAAVPAESTSSTITTFPVGLSPINIPPSPWSLTSFLLKQSDNEGISDKNGSTESENEFITATESERENKKVKELTESDSGDQNTSDSEE